MKVERILFPTDFSSGAQNALPCAVDLAEHYNSKLYILHVVYDINKAVGVHVPHISSDEVYREMNDWAMEQIASCCVEEIRKLSDVEKKVVQGIPNEEILKFAADEKIDMIVMGTYGRVGIERLIFGNTAERVVRRAPCPVLTVRIPEHRR
ncbi:MAG: universal stress protein [Nitrospiraceae bacterium]|nr:MAG: universal stress protein [Nitrospiraceae bacterium]